MKEVDERIVEMRFDNRDFEKNVNTTIKSLDNLNESLKFKDSGLAIRNVGESLTDLAKRTVVFTTIQRLVTSLENKVSSLWHQFSTMATAAQGFTIYEDKMGSVQTIMASTGESLDTVNEKLAELQKYSDQTIYSLRDMTNNIGKFTNAGVKLGDAVQAIEGVSNLAAISGAGAAEASRAMYNFAQALSAGYVKLIDWKSIENANMATVEFKNQLIETAVAEGKLTKTADGMYKTLNGKVIDATHNFNDSLSDQWMSTEVLTKTLARYNDTNTEIGQKAYNAATEVKTFTQMINVLKESLQSGWSRTWEVVVGNLEEAKKLFTDIITPVGKFLDNMSAARNALLQGWKDLGGREELLVAFGNIFRFLGSVIKQVGDVFRELFPKKTSDQLYRTTQRFRLFTETLVLSEDAVKNIKSTVRGILSPIATILRYLKQLISWASPKLISFLRVAFDYLFKITAYISELGIAISKKLYNAFGSLTEVIKKVGNAIKGSEIFNIAKNIVAGLYNGIKKTLSKVGDAAKMIADKLVNTVKKLLGIHSPSKVFEEIGTWTTEGLWIGIKDSLTKIYNIAKTIADRIVEGFKSGKVIERIKAFFEAIKNKALAFWAKVEPIFTKIKDFFVALWNKLEPVREELKRLAEQGYNELMAWVDNLNVGGMLDELKKVADVGLIASLTKFFFALSSVVKGADDIGEGFVRMGKAFQKAAKGFANKANADALLSFAKSVVLFAAAIVLLTAVPFDDLDRLNKAVLTMVEIVGMLVAAIAGLSAIQAIFNATAFFNGTAMVGLALGLLGFIGALYLVYTMESKMGTDGMNNTVKRLGELVEQIIAISLGAALAKGGMFGLLALGVGVIMFVKAIEAVADMDADKIEEGMNKLTNIITVVMGLFAQATLAAILPKNNGFGVSLMILSAVAAVLILIEAVKKIIEITKTVGENKVKKAIGMVAILAGIVGGLIAVVAVLSILNNTIGEKGKLIKITAMLIVMMGAIVALAALCVFLGEVGDTFWKGLGKLGSIVGVIVGLIVIAGVMSMLVSKFEGTGSLVAIIFLIASIVGAIFALSYVTKEVDINQMWVIIGILGAFAVVIAALGIIGKQTAGGILAVSVVMISLAAAIAVLSWVLKDMDTDQMLRMVAVILAFAVAIGVAGLAGSAGAPGLLAVAVVLLALSVAAIAVAAALMMGALAFTIFTEAIMKLASYLSSNDVVAICKDMAMLFGALSLALIECGGSLILFGAMFVASAALIIAGAVLIGVSSVLIVAFSGALYLLSGAMYASGAAFDFFGEKLDSIAQHFANFINTIRSIFGRGEKGSESEEIGGNFVQGLINGIKNKTSILGSTMKAVGSGVLGVFRKVLRIDSPSKKTYEMGQFMDMGFANGVTDFSYLIGNASEDAAESSLDGFQNGFDGINLEDMFDDPTIRPVLDLSNIKDGAGDIGSLLGGSSLFGSLSGFGGGIGSVGNMQINMTVNGAQGQDVNELADVVIDRINSSIIRRDTTWH